MTEAEIEAAIESMCIDARAADPPRPSGLSKHGRFAKRLNVSRIAPAELAEFLCRTHAGCNRDIEVTRIEWRYLDGAPESDRTGEKDLPRRERPTGGMQWLS